MSLQSCTTSKCPGPSSEDDFEMKRTIHSVQAASPESTVSTANGRETNPSKRKDDSDAPDSRLSTYDYWKEKAKDLQNVFAEDPRGRTTLKAASYGVGQGTAVDMDVCGDDSKGSVKPRPAALDLSKTRSSSIPASKVPIQLQTPPLDADQVVKGKEIEYDNIVRIPPLPGSSISDILLQTKPHCPKAQAWTNAQRVSQETKERWLEKTTDGRTEGLNIRENVHLKMTVALLLAEKTRERRQTRQTELNQLSQQLRHAHLDRRGQQAPPAQGSEGSSRAPDNKMEKDMVEKEWEEKNLTPQQRVRRAHDRLQKALGLDE